MRTVFSQILTGAGNVPDKIAVVSGDRTLSYGELRAKVARFAAELFERHRVGAGDRVLLLAGSNADFVCAYLAVHSIGAICAPLDPASSSERLADVAERLSPALMLSEDGSAPCPGKQMSFGGLAAGAEDAAAAGPASVSLDDTADVLFTTGTTGRAKGVILSHRAIAASTAHINDFVGTGADDVEVLPLPLSHSFGLGRLRCVLTAGASLVLVPGFLNPGKLLEIMQGHAATGFASVPAGIAILLAHESEALRSFANRLRYLEIGSAAMPLEHKKRLMASLPRTRICMHYGLTEASRSAYLSFHEDREKLESIGRPSRGVEMRIADDGNAEGPANTEGEIQVRGAHLLKGYWQDAELTEASLRGGWLNTGDLGRRDADGYFYLSARTSDMINVGGRKVSPEEIERVLLRHPAVAECACVGLPDPQGLSGQIISAYLVGNDAVDQRPGFPELARLLRQTLEPYKIPRQFHWVNAIPKSSSGKVLRRQLHA